MIEVRQLTKRYGPHTVVNDLSFRVDPGKVTGFLGPNGSGKTTTARMILGLTDADEGVATIGGRTYRDLRRPLCEIGALINAGAVIPSRTAIDHVRWLAAANGISKQRADEVLGMVGLEAVAGRKVGGFSLGMKQRLGIAAALIGDPPVLLFDEPINGLDPEGIRWIRTFMQGLAAEGRTVFVSSHLMSEMALTATELIVIGQGRLIAAESVEKFTERADSSVRLRSPQLDEMATALAVEGASLWRNGDALEIVGFSIEQVGAIAARVGAIVYELSPQRASLEEAFMQLTAAVCEYVPMQQGA
ncbi:MAG TPA: ATP-binding cassette domain-containing protein [Acidothermaceae bacterium]|jgi:ABC-2 type transport system ATP-binding protein|nr:ATP-binding cassette domain-containing protein [Acidothermaceae bacterium]